MKDRIVIFIESEGLTPAEFADQIGIQRSSLSHVLNGRNNPGFSFIQKILTTYPKINSRWLITGDGNMLNENEQIKPIETHQRTLFDSKPENNTEQSPIIKKKAEIQTINVSEPSITTKQTNNPTEEQTAKTVDNIQPNLPQHTEKKATKTVKRVLIFYDDHTFDDYRPSE
jgi:transcriptional regulator with XRE-family HTH domain